MAPEASENPPKKQLSEPKETAENLANYTVSLTSEKYPLGGDLWCSLLVPPGQARQRMDSWTRLFRELAGGKSQGVINIVSWGMHTFKELGYEDHALFSEGMTKDAFVSRYTETKQQEELEVIEELAPHLKTAQGKLWMTTLVTKQDLWWRERYDVQAFYEEGQYQKRIDEILASRGAQNFVHQYLSASLVRTNWRDGKREPLMETAQGYEDSIRDAHLRELYEAVVDLSTMEK